MEIKAPDGVDLGVDKSKTYYRLTAVLPATLAPRDQTIVNMETEMKRIGEYTIFKLTKFSTLNSNLRTIHSRFVAGICLFQLASFVYSQLSPTD